MSNLSFSKSLIDSLSLSISLISNSFRLGCLNVCNFKLSDSKGGNAMGLNMTGYHTAPLHFARLTEGGTQALGGKDKGEVPNYLRHKISGTRKNFHKDEKNG